MAVPPSLFDAPVPYARGSDTSEEAARALEPRAPMLRRLVLEAFEEAGPRGLTADQAAECVGLSILAVRPRVTELYQAGKLERAMERRQNESGMWARVLRVVTR